MSSGTEIYVCKAGQKLENGQMEFVPNPMDRMQAEVDARERMERDESIAKIGYYAVDGEGGFKPIYTAESPTVGAAEERPKVSQRQPGSGPKKVVAKRSLLSRLLDLVTEEAR